MHPDWLLWELQPGQTHVAAEPSSLLHLAEYSRCSETVRERKELECQVSEERGKKFNVLMESDVSSIPLVLHYRGVASRCSGWSETGTATVGWSARGLRWSRCAAQTGGTTRAPASCRGRAAKIKPWHWRTVGAAEVSTQRPANQTKRNERWDKMFLFSPSTCQVEAWGKATSRQRLQWRRWRLSPETWKWKVRTRKRLSSMLMESWGDELKGNTVLRFQDSNPALNHVPICKPVIFPWGD